MAYADFSRFVVTTDFSAREISRDKPPVFPRLPSQFTHTGYGCLLDFVTLGPLIRRIRLSIGFLFVGLRFRYPFLSPAPRSANLGSRFGVRRQLRPLWTFTTDRRHARRTDSGAGPSRDRLLPYVSCFFKGYRTSSTARTIGPLRAPDRSTRRRGRYFPLW